MKPRPKAKWELLRDARRERTRHKQTLLVFPGKAAVEAQPPDPPPPPVLPAPRPLPPMIPAEHPLPKRERDAFLHRILRALGESYSAVSKITGLAMWEIASIETPQRGQLVEVNRDAFWTRLSDHVDERIGELISIREEMSRKLAADRKAQVRQRLRIMRR